MCFAACAHVRTCPRAVRECFPALCIFDLRAALALEWQKHCPPTPWVWMATFCMSVFCGVLKFTQTQDQVGLSVGLKPPFSASELVVILTLSGNFSS